MSTAWPLSPVWGVHVLVLSTHQLLEGMEPNRWSVVSVFTRHSTCWPDLLTPSCYFPLSLCPHPRNSNVTLHTFLSHHALFSETRLERYINDMCCCYQSVYHAIAGSTGKVKFKGPGIPAFFWDPWGSLPSCLLISRTTDGVSWGSRQGPSSKI